MIKKRMMANMMRQGPTNGVTFWEQAREVMAEREKRHYYWNMLRRARQDFDGVDLHDEHGPLPQVFSRHLQRIYGIRPNLDSEYRSLGEYTVLDEKKYLLFLLNYGA
jgi:hypothetical protein